MQARNLKSAMFDLRLIPSIDELRRRPAMLVLEARFGTDATLDALRAAATGARAAILAGDAGWAAESAVVERIERLAASHLGDMFKPSLQPVINATGVVIHTNLGRAPLALAAIARVVEVARGYSSLEYDLERGTRGRREVHAEALLCRLTGAEAAVVVNNNAAAMLLVVAALAAGREVIVSRGELVEIGGGFRIPDVLAQSGAVLREVGTTNRTRGSDLGAAINERTALLLRVHPSNFRIEGFSERPSLTDYVTLGKKFNVPVAEDLGSGHLRVRPGSDPLATEPAVDESIAAGVDICCFSGDKLLGGPQAGIIVGRAALIEKIRRHPLMRALRVDKMTYAALEATLAEYAAGRAAVNVPVQRMLTATVDELHARADILAAAINTMRGWRAGLTEGFSAIGGGSAPGVELPTWLVAIAKDGLSPDALGVRLRHLDPPVIARIEDDRVLLDPRTILPEQDSRLPPLLAAI